MRARLFFDIGRWVVRVGLALALAVSFLGTGGTTWLEAANPAAFVWRAASFLPLRVGASKGVKNSDNLLNFESLFLRLWDCLTMRV